MSFLESSPADKNLNLWMYEKMLSIRIFEQFANELYLSAKMPGLTHLYSGQEAVAVGACACLSSSDYITSTHRGHGHCVAKGANFKEMFAELLGKQSGYCKGKGGSMHIADQENGNLGANAIVGGSIGLATGAGLSAKKKKNGRVTVCFFGEGATGQGLFYECLNMAALWKLPVIYLCENNMYNEYTHYSEVTSGKLDKRAETFGIQSMVLNGQDAREVFQAVSSCVKKCREGKGPFYLLCNTYRFHGHHVGDINRSFYRAKEEETEWKTKKDPIQILREKLVKEKKTTIKNLEAIEKKLRKEGQKAVDFALNDSYPNTEEVNNHIFKEIFAT